MAMELKLTGLKGFVGEDELAYMAPLVQAAQDTLHARTGAGNDFLGWVDLPEDYDKEEFARIKAAAKKIQQSCDVLVVIGIGGSYLGARAAIEFVNGQMYNSIRPDGIPEVYFVGSNISSSYLNDVIKIIATSVSMLSPSRVPRPSLRSRSAFSKSCVRTSTARTAQRTASSPRPTRRAAHSKSWRTMRATRPLSCRTTSAAVSPY